MQPDEQGQNYLNLTKKERKAMKELMNDCSNIIKPAYKGSRIVTWGKQDYLRECENQLTDVNVYEKVEGYPARATNKKICKVFDNMLRKKEIHKKLKSWKYIREQPLYQEDLLFPVTVEQLKRFRLSLIFT